MALFSGKSFQVHELERIQNTLAPILKPLGKLYGFFMDRRAREYSQQKVYHAGIPCISIGNIALGGTGKTPLTDWFLGWAESCGKKAAVLTRGYGAKTPYYPYTVSLQSKAAESGDEPLMLALKHPLARVIVDPVRRRGAVLAVHEYHPDFLVMDDGFQHLALHRDVDIVLLRPKEFMENWDRVLPAGMWRESASALGRASVFLVRADEVAFEQLEPLLKERLKAFTAPVFSFTLQATGLELILGQKIQSSDSPCFSSAWNHRVVHGQTCSDTPVSDYSFEKKERDVSKTISCPYLLVSGVGSPEDVRRTVTQFLGRAPDKHCIFADHHAYTEQDALHIGTLAKTQNLIVVTTAKDAQKLAVVADFSFYSCMVTIRFGTKALIWDRQSNKARLVGQSFDQWWEQKARDIGLIHDAHAVHVSSSSEQTGQHREEMKNG